MNQSILRIKDLNCTVYDVLVVHHLTQRTFSIQKLLQESSPQKYISENLEKID